MSVGRAARRPGPALGGLLLLALACQYEHTAPVLRLGSNTSFVDGYDPARCPSVPPAALKTSGEACACDIQCDTGTCTGGICCSGSGCSALRPLGIICQKPEQCASGFCADGACCNVACTGACVACNRPDQMGQCAPIPAGSEDRHGICRKDPPESCGQTGICNGRGGCARYAASTTCRPASCDGPSTMVSPSLCDGEGTCVPGAPLACSPSTCEAGSCLASCTSHAACMSPNSCYGGSCGPRGLGQDCDSNNQCKSAFCVDGVCCDTACGSPCSFCASAEARGRCLPVKADLPDPRAARGDKDPARACVDQGAASCGSNGRCDGKGACQKYPDGTACGQVSCDATANRESPAPTCSGGSCQAGESRSCAPYLGCSGSRCRSSCGSDAQCASGNVCLAGDCGKRPLGAVCTRAGDCASNVCAQGRCCAGPCTGTCRSCALPGQEGSCASVPAGEPDPAGACRDDACSNGCDGAGACRREPGGTACGPARCEGNGVLTNRCNAAGACEPATMPCAAGQMCTEARCVTPPPPPAPPPAPPPSPPQPPQGSFPKFFVDTFAAGNGYRAPNCLSMNTPFCKPVGRLLAQTNYVFCKKFGDEMRVGADFNHWWLLTDLDEVFPGGTGRAYVSAYYLTRWGNDVAKDNNGRVIPDCP